MKIIPANMAHIELITPLFDAYRQFYKQKSDIEGARAFISNNLTNQHASIFLALNEHDKALGFVQLYPTWESVTMTKRWVLYDLYVAESGRKKGIATQLMNQAKQLAKDTQAKYIMLETAVDNTTAQRLYESLGYERDDEFYTYTLEVSD